MSIPSIVIRPVAIVFMLLIKFHDQHWFDSRDGSPTRSPQLPYFDDDDDNDYDNDNDDDDKDDNDDNADGITINSACHPHQAHH